MENKIIKYITLYLIKVKEMGVGLDNDQNQRNLYLAMYESKCKSFRLQIDFTSTSKDNIKKQFSLNLNNIDE